MGSGTRTARLRESEHGAAPAPLPIGLYPWVLLASPQCHHHRLHSSPDLTHSRSACGKGGPLKEATSLGRVWALRGQSAHGAKMEDREASLAGD